MPLYDPYIKLRCNHVIHRDIKKPWSLLTIRAFCISHHEFCTRNKKQTLSILIGRLYPSYARKCTLFNFFNKSILDYWLSDYWISYNFHRRYTVYLKSGTLSQLLRKLSIVFYCLLFRFESFRGSPNKKPGKNAGLYEWLPVLDEFSKWLFSEEAVILSELKNELAVF